MRYLLIFLGILLVSCAPIKPEVSNRYKLEAFSRDKVASRKTDMTILVSQSQAIPGYQTEEMLYSNKPYQISAFVKNSWVSPPAGMITPLIAQSLEHSNFFFAVASGPDADKTDYRLDTQIIDLKQNFLTKPSQIEFVIQVDLTHVDDNRLISSQIFVIRTPCQSNNPYGGVVAANKTLRLFTKQLTNYVIYHIKIDNKLLIEPNN
jgi:cholesterol transport system auxiliary component